MPNAGPASASTAPVTGAAAPSYARPPTDIPAGESGSGSGPRFGRPGRRLSDRRVEPPGGQLSGNRSATPRADEGSSDPPADGPTSRSDARPDGAAGRGGCTPDRPPPAVDPPVGSPAEIAVGTAHVVGTPERPRRQGKRVRRWHGQGHPRWRPGGRRRAGTTSAHGRRRRAGARPPVRDAGPATPVDTRPSLPAPKP